MDDACILPLSVVVAYSQHREVHPHPTPIALVYVFLFDIDSNAIVLEFQEEQHHWQLRK
jgi:hypothetical protein